MKTAPGTIDGLGNPVLLGSDNVNADFRNSSGYILTGPEYYTVFDGLTGAQLDTIPLVPARGNVTSWGDNFGNRADRFTASVAYLDGHRPSAVVGRGYYGPRSGFSARNEIAAYDFRDSNGDGVPELSVRWVFAASTNGPNANYIGQGAHWMGIGDVDQDGRDEIVYGASVIDDNGTGLYSTGLGHGDAMHVGDLDPTRPGLEVFMVHESADSNGNVGASLRDARTGEILQQITATGDIGRGVAGNIDPNRVGYEFWATAGSPRQIFNVDGTALYSTPSNMMYNFVVYWDGDLSHELLDGTTISKWNNPGRQNIVTAGNFGAAANNGTKNTPALQADILGDWREEVIWRNGSSTELQIWTTTTLTTHRLYTLMHDLHYRVAVAGQNSAYNQPPHPGFYIGEGMAPPPTPAIYYVGGDTPAPIMPRVYQAEDAFLQNIVGVESNHSGFTGTGFVNAAAAGSIIQFDNVDGGDGGPATLTFRYALGATARTGLLTVNGTNEPITFDSTGGWNVWTTLTLTRDLVAGLNNTIVLISTGQDLANLDRLDVLPTINPPAQVGGAWLFHNGSILDGYDDALNATDTAAVDGRATPWRSDDASAVATAISAARGITGVMFDLAGAPGALTLADLEVLAGDPANPATWVAGPTPTGLLALPGGGEGGADRYLLSFAAGSAVDTWLGVRIAAGSATGLDEAVTLFFRHDPGVRPDFTGDGQLTAADLDFLRTSLRLGLVVTSAADVNADGTFDQGDIDFLVGVELGTVYGDVNLDGQVTALGDLSPALARLGQPGTWGWADGDVDGDGTVTALADLSVILARLTPVAEPAGDAATASADPAPPPTPVVADPVPPGARRSAGVAPAPVAERVRLSAAGLAPDGRLDASGSERPRPGDAASLEPDRATADSAPPTTGRVAAAIGRRTTLVDLSPPLDRSGPRGQAHSDPRGIGRVTAPPDLLALLARMSPTN
jgi:hypothetical protein